MSICDMIIDTMTVVIMKVDPIIEQVGVKRGRYRIARFSLVRSPVYPMDRVITLFLSQKNKNKWKRK